jgi:hypothetical protein
MFDSDIEGLRKDLSEAQKRIDTGSTEEDRLDAAREAGQLRRDIRALENKRLNLGRK